jgi:iron complex transport system ATP-binding protein
MISNNKQGYLEAKSVTVYAGKKVLIQDIDFTIKPGSLHVILGPNGAGKSTLLRSLTGEHPADSGTISLDGKILRNYDSIELAKRRACLPQSSTLSFPFTIGEVVTIGRHPHSETATATRAIVDAALEKVGLLSRMNESYLHLSGGEKQRVHLARVLCQLEKPEGRILLLDEPTASLDLTYQQLVFTIAREWASKGASVCVVLHDLNQAMCFAHEVTVMHKGQVVGQGRPEKVLTSELIESVYSVSTEWIRSEGCRLLSIKNTCQNFYNS